MKATDEKAALMEKIVFLKQKQSYDFVVLKQQYDATIASFKPMNLIKSASLEFISSSDLKSNLIKGAIDFGTAYLTKNVMNENSVNPIKRVLGKLMKFVLKNSIGKNRR